MQKTIAIIGAGASGVFVFSQLVEQLAGADDAAPKIILIEKGREFGPGVAYSTPLDAHLLNQYADTMGGVVGDPAHFSKWVASTPQDDLTEDEKGALSGDEFPPRKLYGRYLKDMFAKALASAAASGATVQRVHDEAVSVNPGGAGWRIELAGGTSIQSDVTILALGNFPSPVGRDLWDAKGFFRYPWPVEAIVGHISGTDPVCVLGSGLSAIDTFHTLRAAGQTAKVYFVSRSGILPKVRGLLADYELQFLRLDKVMERASKTQPPRLDLDKLIDLFCRELENAEGGPIDWQKVAHPEGSPLEILERDLEKADNRVRPYQVALIATEGIIGRLWNLLSFDDQCRFDREYKNLWNAYRYPMPPKNARKVLDALRSGQLEVLPGITHISHNEETGIFGVELRDRDGVCRTLEVPTVINATGQCMDAARIDSRILDQLLANGLAVQHPSGGINVDFETGRVIDGDGAASDTLFALGELTRGVHFFTNGVTPCALRAHDIVRFITGSLTD